MIVSNFRIISVGCLNCDEKIDLPQKNSHKKRDSISFSCASCQEQYEVIIMDRK